MTDAIVSSTRNEKMCLLTESSLPGYGPVSTQFSMNF